VPSFESRRLHGQSNLNTWRDGIRVLRALLVERLDRRGTGHLPARRPATDRNISPPQPASEIAEHTSVDQVSDVPVLNSA
jgi:hypothetical protein